MNRKTFCLILALVMALLLALGAACQPQAQPETPALTENPPPTKIVEEPPPTMAVSAPEEIANAWMAALAKENIDEALSYLAPDAVVSIIPPGDNSDGVYNGHAEIRGWYEPIVAAHGVGTLSDCKLSGDTLTCLNTYADDGLKGMGVDSIEGEWVAVFQDGKIQSYTFTMTPESLAKFPPPPEAVISSPTPLAEEAVDQLEDVLGTWAFSLRGEKYLIQYLEDGFYNLGWEGNLTGLDRGQYSLEGNQLHYLTAPRSCPDAQEVTYEVYVTYRDGIPAKLRFVLVGEDNCPDRKQASDGKTMLRYKP